jgi:hypothetical protein
MSATNIDNVVNFHPMTPARREGAYHPALTAADISRMSPHELVYFTDAPAAHVCAYLDFRREQMLDARRRDALAHLVKREADRRRNTLVAEARAHGWDAGRG